MTTTTQRIVIERTTTTVHHTDLSSRIMYAGIFAAMGSPFLAFTLYILNRAFEVNSYEVAALASLPGAAVAVICIPIRLALLGKMQTTTVRNKVINDGPTH